MGTEKMESNRANGKITWVLKHLNHAGALETEGGVREALEGRPGKL